MSYAPIDFRSRRVEDLEPANSHYSDLDYRRMHIRLEIRAAMVAAVADVLSERVKDWSFTTEEKMAVMWGVSGAEGGLSSAELPPTGHGDVRRAADNLRNRIHRSQSVTAVFAYLSDTVLDAAKLLEEIDLAESASSR